MVWCVVPLFVTPLHKNLNDAAENDPYSSSTQSQDILNAGCVWVVVRESVCVILCVREISGLGASEAAVRSS